MTPGPWALMRTAYTGHLQVRDEAEEIVIALIPERTGDAAQSNARLIAAAPDLLAALEEVLPYVLMGGSGKAQHDLKANARAAIAKARGE